MWQAPPFFKTEKNVSSNYVEIEETEDQLLLIISLHQVKKIRHVVRINNLICKSPNKISSVL